jgi:CDP-paratose 2-epimerase
MTLAGIDSARPVLITGGAGFIGCNLAHRLLTEGRRVIVFDNMSRGSVERNLAFLRARHAGRLEIVTGDVRHPTSVVQAVQRASAVFHFAAQVAVTTSLTAPAHDFETNARGTLNVLEALRGMRAPVPLLFTSTNKVYGALDDVRLITQQQRCAPAEQALAESGVNESRPLDFHSPYGCSKGAADQYVCDYARSFGLPAIVFRMSCIYGPRQFGNEDQGWLAHFLLKAQRDEPITIYGDGCQVRDVLFVDDLIEAMLLAHANIRNVSGRAFNIGGGPRNTLSLLELLDLIGELTGRKPRVEFSEPRVGDQRYYVSDTRAFQQQTGWSPQVDVRSGVERLAGWTSSLSGAGERDDVLRGAAR